MTEPILSCRNVTVNFGGVKACNEISLEVPEGKIIGLIGPNGAGKTTLFNVLTRFQQQSSGDVFMRGRNVNRKRPHDMISLGMARTFQNINLFKAQTTLDNILIGSHVHIGNPLASMFWLGNSRKKEAELHARAEELAVMFHLTSELDSPVGTLPYGFQKRVELARALAPRPELLLLDEPVAGCNDEETEEIQETVRSINREHGITVLLVEHDMSMVMSICDYIYVINFGSNLAEGTPAEIRSNPDVITAYLGQEDD
ncbi:MAG: ATP-binding cassette domain-containing protein [Rhizobiales bacterium]|nr:ATP-binding cassette domain-containing protein [Hyphomicrobiales bacterium]